MTGTRIHETIRLSADGLAKVLGDLEARVMQTAWRLAAPAAARAIHERVIAEHDVALHTVITVLNRLVNKGLLRREKRDGVLHYEARLTEEAFREQRASNGGRDPLLRTGCACGFVRGCARGAGS